MENDGGHFQIYVPGAFTGTQAQFESFGILELKDGTHTTIPVDQGPDGKSGTLVGWEMTGAEAIVPSYDKEKQTWFPAAAVEDDEEDFPEGRYWYGFYKDRPVTPDKLRKSTKYVSGVVELGDGNEWLIPIAEHMPHVWTPRGRIVAADFKQYSEMANRYYDLFGGFTDFEDYKVRDGWDFCCIALAFNYRITPDIIGGLTLIDDAKFSVIAMASVELDLLQIIDDQKKREDLPSIQDG